MQQAGQVPHLDQNDAHEQSLGQSDGSLPGPEQTLNHSLTPSYEGWPDRNMQMHAVLLRRLFAECPTAFGIFSAGAMNASCAAMETLNGAAVCDQRKKSFEARQSYMNCAS